MASRRITSSSTVSCATTSMCTRFLPALSSGTSVKNSTGRPGISSSGGSTMTEGSSSGSWMPLSASRSSSAWS